MLLKIRLNYGPLYVSHKHGRKKILHLSFNQITNFFFGWFFFIKAYIILYITEGGIKIIFLYVLLFLEERRTKGVRRRYYFSEAVISAAIVFILESKPFTSPRHCMDALVQSLV